MPSITHHGLTDACFYEEHLPARGFFAVETARPAATKVEWNRCTCRGRCRGHAPRTLSEKKAGVDLPPEEEESWQSNYPRPYEEDFRAPLDVPVDHPTYASELELRRRRILALNKQMRRRDEALWLEYMKKERLARCTVGRIQAALHHWLEISQGLEACGPLER